MTKSAPINNGDALLVLATANQNHLAKFLDVHTLLYQTGKTTTVILTPMYGGIWTLCISLTGTYSPFNYNITNKYIIIKYKNGNEQSLLLFSNNIFWHH